MSLVLLCLLLFSSNLFVQSADVESVIALKAINGVIKSYFAKEGPQVTLVYSGLAGGKAEAMSEKILRTKSDDVAISYTIASLYEHNQGLKFGSSTVFIFDSKDYFHSFAKVTSEWTGNNVIWHKHLVYAPGLTAADILLHYNASIAIGEVAFLINYNGSSLDLATAFMYTAQECGVNQMRTINRFSKPFEGWESDEFYPDKYKNFHGCPLVVHYRGGIGGIGRLEGFFFELLAISFNFTFNPINCEEYEDFNQKIKTDLAVNMYFRDEMGFDRTKFHLSSTLFMDEMTILVPAGLPLTDLEKMVVMFDTETWIAIGCTFAVAFITIQVINWTSRTVQNFVFGRDIRAPTLNTVSVFLTGGQSRLPGRNFARYLLMMFMMWSLIFRTCYQSKMYENLQTDMRHPRVRSFDDFNKMNFTLLIQMVDGLVDSEAWIAQLLDGRIKNFKKIPYEEDIDQVMMEPEAKFGKLVERSIYTHYIKRNLISGLPSTRLLDEKFDTIRYSLMLTRKLPYSERFLRILNEISASGITQREHILDLDFTGELTKKDDLVGPQVLTLWQLGLGFLIFLVACGLSVLAFVLEMAIDLF